MGIFFSPVGPNSKFFAITLCCNFSTGLDFHKGFLIYGWLSKSLFSRAFWITAVSVWGQFKDHCSVHSWTKITRHMVGKSLPGSVASGAGSQFSQRHFCLCVDARLLLLRWGYDEGHLSQPSCWCLLVYILHGQHILIWISHMSSGQ